MKIWSIKGSEIAKKKALDIKMRIRISINRGTSK